MDSINPATGKRIKSYPEYSYPKIDRIFKNAQNAFELWRTLSFEARGLMMQKAAHILRKNQQEYARLMAVEMGKPLEQGLAEIEKCAWACDFYAKEAERYLTPIFIPTDGSRSFVSYDPLGIVLAVMPWNFPFWQVFRCAAPTLMAGNGVLLKHASNVSGCALAIESIFKEAGFPEGIFSNVLIGSDKVASLIRHPLIQAVTVTGSTEAGKNIAAAAGAVIKKTVLELGGSDAYVVLEDADLEQTVNICAASRLLNGGQSCISAKRFIVHESIFNLFTDKFIEAMRRQRMGSPLEEGITLGPLARHDLREQLHEQVLRSVWRGAKIVMGGRIPTGRGAYYPPTILINVKPGMPAYQEELFGPVASVLKARTEHEAVALANDTVFGLGGAVFSRDIKRAERIATKDLRVGCCFVNDMVRSDPRLPFGGIKQSGYGRELADFGIREFVNVKTVYVK